MHSDPQRKNPKNEETKRKEIHFTNFSTVAAHKLMKFMIELVTACGLRDSIEVENGLPVMYPFGQTVAKACVIRCISEERAKAIIRQLHSDGNILFGAGDDQRKIRVQSGFDNRNPEQKAAEFQMRKLRSAIH